ncbi:TLD domain-containing protein [Candidatus Bathyarchaeota archaeon]|nr:TLD domain-containing protein [Candidatus Bathyarchaeota archaeon]
MLMTLLPQAADFRCRLGHDGRATLDRTYNLLLNHCSHRLHHLWRDIHQRDIQAFFKFPPELDAADIVFEILRHVGAFPFCRDGLVPLRKVELMMTISMMTDHYQSLLEVPEGIQGSKTNWDSWDRLELVFDSLAVDSGPRTSEAGDEVEVDAELPPGSNSSSAHSCATSRPHVVLPRRRLHLKPGAAPSNNKRIDCDLLVMAAHDSLGMKSHTNQPESHGHIPIGKLRKFLHLMLVTRVAWPRDKLWGNEEGQDQMIDRATDSMKGTFAKAVAISGTPGVTIEHFYRIIPVYFPNLFEGLAHLFGEFLSEARLSSRAAKGPLIERHWKEGLGPMIMCDAIIMQLGMFLPRSQLLCGPALVFHSVHDTEVNMAEFESRTNGLKRTVLLVKGITVPNKRWGGGKTSWHDSLVDVGSPAASPQTRTYGVYLPEPWQPTGEFTFGGQDMLLFRLEPTHEVFPVTGAKDHDYMWFPETREGRRSMITFGSPPRHKRWQRPTWPWPALPLLGGVSLMVEGGMRNAVFLHNRRQPHSFRPSAVDENQVVNEVLAVERVEVWRFR